MESPSALAAFQAIRSAHGKALPQVEVVWDGVSVTGSKPAGRCASKPAPLLEDVHAKARPGRLTIVRTCTAVSHHAATGPREPVSFPWRESRGHCLLEVRVAPWRSASSSAATPLLAPAMLDPPVQNALTGTPTSSGWGGCWVCLGRKRGGDASSAGRENNFSVGGLFAPARLRPGAPPGAGPPSPALFPSCPALDSLETVPSAPLGRRGRKGGGGKPARLSSKVVATRTFWRGGLPPVAQGAPPATTRPRPRDPGRMMGQWHRGSVFEATSTAGLCHGFRSWPTTCATGQMLPPQSDARAGLLPALPCCPCSLQCARHWEARGNEHAATRLAERIVPQPDRDAISAF